jgi:hypothetical protein
MTRNEHLKSWNDVYETLVDKHHVLPSIAEQIMFRAFDDGVAKPDCGTITFVTGQGFRFTEGYVAVAAL